MDIQNQVSAAALSSKPPAPWLRPLALITAVLFFISLGFPTVAGLAKDTASFPKWWGTLDVGLAFTLGIMATVMIAVTERRVDKQAVDASYRAYRILIHGILGVIVAFFLLGDRITWINCATGFGWRTWLLLYGLPGWFTAVRSTAATS